jgi:hypothetical protein
MQDALTPGKHDEKHEHRHHLAGGQTGAPGYPVSDSAAAGTGTMGVYSDDGGVPGSGMPASVGQQRAGMEGSEKAGLGAETFTVTEDRPRVVERREAVLEHRPVEKEFVREVREVGERAMPGESENLGTTQQVVSEGAWEGTQAEKEATYRQQ